MKIAIVAFMITFLSFGYGQTQHATVLKGSVMGEGSGLKGAVVSLIGTPYRISSDAQGNFSIVDILPAKYILQGQAGGFTDLVEECVVNPGANYRGITLQKTS